jgi:hypothetical protein
MITKIGYDMPKNRHRTLSFLINPLPLWEGARGRGNQYGYSFTLSLTLSHKGRGNF